MELPLGLEVVKEEVGGGSAGRQGFALSANTNRGFLHRGERVAGVLALGLLTVRLEIR